MDSGYEIFMLVAGIVLVLSSIVLVVIVLIQSNSSKGLSGAIAGGSETFYGKNKKNSIEKKLLIVTIVVAILFALVSLGISSFQKNDLLYYIRSGWDLDGDGKINEEEEQYINWYENFGIDLRPKDNHEGHDHD